MRLKNAIEEKDDDEMKLQIEKIDCLNMTKKQFFQKRNQRDQMIDI